MKFLIKKITGLIIALLIVSMLAFLAFEVIPGDPARTILGTEATEAKVEVLRDEMGLNRPLPVRYGEWIKNFVAGDMGTSYSYQIPVKELIADKIPITAAMTLMSLIGILLLSVPLGILCVRFENRAVDKIFLVLNQIMMSVPPFFIGMLLTVVFGLVFHVFTPGEYISYTEDIGGFLRYLVLPSLAIALPKAAMTMKMLRSSMLSQMGQEYVRTARSRGNGPWRILLVHVFKNGFLPVITFLGVMIADVIANSIVVEQVFGIPGLGRTLITSIAKRDYPVVEAVIVWLAVVILVINAAVDLLYRRLDKRIEI